MSVLLCLCTCPDAATARSLAERLVDERLCACVNLLPGVLSIYHWQGRREQAQETVLLIKTTTDAWPRLQQRVQALHLYSVPELVALPVERGLPAYLDWICAETAPSGGTSA